MIRQKTKDNIKILSKASTDLQTGVLKKLCETDLQLFSLYFFSEYNKYEHNEFHVTAFDLLEEGEQRLAIAASRGLAKSTTFSLISLVHDICYSRERYIVLFSNTESQALSHSKNLIKELKDNKELRRIFGDLLPRNYTPSDFVCTNNVKITARGSGSSVRGLRHGSHRPTKIILDDVEDDQTVLNPATREKFKDWFEKEVSPLGSEITKIHFIGTVLHEKSLLVEVQNNPVYTAHTFKMIKSWATNQRLWDTWEQVFTDRGADEADQFYKDNEVAMLEGTEVMWPTRLPYISLQKEILQIGYSTFMQEKQMEAVDTSKALFSTFHKFSIVKPTNQFENGVIVDSDVIYFQLGDTTLVKNVNTFDVVMAVDPSISGNGDCCAINISYVDKINKKIYVFKDWTKPAKATEWVAVMLTLSQEYKVNKVYIESNVCNGGILETFIREARKNLIDKGTLLPSFKLPTIYKVITVKNKETRLGLLEPLITNGTYKFVTSGLSNEFWNQLTSYRQGFRCTDDVPDSLEHIYSQVFAKDANQVVAINHSDLVTA